jgi:hypothetical protein
MSSSFPPLLSLINIFNDESQCITWLFDNHAVDLIEQCLSCGGEVRPCGKMFHCRSRNCRKKFSIFRNSFFAKSKLQCNQALLLCYFWLGGDKYTQIRRYTGHSSATVSAFTGYCRQLVSSSLDDVDGMIGGEGIVVELDESKFGKRKYNRGHRVEGVWVLGGVERTELRAVFAEVVPDRTAETLLEVIGRHVSRGSINHTDLWRGYTNLSSSLGLLHKTVNHSLHFVSEEGVHTNTIEGTWNGIKFMVPSRNRTITDMDDFLPEFIWRRCNASDLWGGFIRTLQIVSYDE